MIRYKTTLCKAVPYTDLNGVSWWDEQSFSRQDILNFWKKLEGYNNGCIRVEKVYLDGSYISADVLSESNVIEGKFLNPVITGTVSEGMCVTRVESVNLLDKFLTEDYCFNEAKPLTEVEENV